MRPTPEEELATLARRQHGVVAARQLHTLGFTPTVIRWRVRKSVFHRLHAGVYAVGHTDLSRRGLWMAAVLAGGPDALLSHRDAAALWELRDPRSSGAIEVSVATRAGRRRPGLTVHRCRLVHPEDRALRQAIPVTSIPRTLLDLAEVVGATQLRRAYERAERLRLLDVRAVERLLARSNGRRGTARLASLLEYDPGPAAQAVSELERRFLDLVREGGLPAPQVNVLVEGWLVDAFWPRAGLVVELDGWDFHRGRDAFERDREKLASLRLAGYDVLAITHRQVTGRPGWVLEAVGAMLAGGGGRARPRSHADSGPTI